MHKVRALVPSVDLDLSTVNPNAPVSLPDAYLQAPVFDVELLADDLALRIDLAAEMRRRSVNLWRAACAHAGMAADALERLRAVASDSQHAVELAAYLDAEVGDLLERFNVDLNRGWDRGGR